MKRVVVLFLALMLAGGLVFAGGRGEKVAEKEQYYWIASFATHPLFLTHDYPALKQEADYWGAEIHFLGPPALDIETQNSMLEQTAAKKPNGILFMPFGEGHNVVIDQVIDRGIPVVCIDGDAPNSQRLCYSGTDWVTLGRYQARVMADLLGGQGTVMLSAVLPNDNTLKARRGIEEERELADGDAAGA